MGRFVDGKAMAETNYLRIQSGPRKGQMASLRSYVLDPKTGKSVKHGLWQWWWEKDGKPRIVEHYDHDRKHGVRKEWNAAGTLVQEAAFDGGKPHGRWRNYHPNGKLKDERTWVKGVLHGPVSTFLEDGSLKNRETWVEGKVTGRKETYHRDGKLAALGHARNGQSHGYYATWDGTGKLTSLSYWVAGKYVKRPEYLAACEKDPSLPAPPAPPED